MTSNLMSSPSEAIGYGEDGSAEINVLRVLNPPLLVKSETGDVTYTYPSSDGEEIAKRYAEKPQEAVKELVSFQSIKPCGHGQAAVEPGKTTGTTMYHLGLTDGEH